MIQIKQHSLKKKTVLLIAVAAVMAVLLIAYVILQAVFSHQQPAEVNPGITLDLLDGESSNVGMPIAYPKVSETQITSISISNATGAYDLMRESDSGQFTLFYQDEHGDRQNYLPDIAAEDSSFSYEDLYAIATGDGYDRIPKLTYLCVALGTLYFQDRIALPEDEHERAVELARFGLDALSVKTAVVRYSEGESASGVHTVRIGDKTVTGTGYYFMVDDRNYVYTSRTVQVSQSASINYLDYALASFASYIQPALVSAGLSMDSTYEPYLTTGFRHYKNTLHETVGEAIVAGAEVIAYGHVVSPIDVIDKVLGAGESADAYKTGNYGELSFQLAELAAQSDPSYGRLVRTLIGKQIGKYYDWDDVSADVTDQILLTLYTQSRAVDLSTASSQDYRYRITAIEGLIREDGEEAHSGAAVGDCQVLRVTYDVYIAGRQVNTAPCHGVLDLTSPLLSAEGVAALRGGAVGTLATPVTFDITYTRDTAVGRNVELLVTAIVAIADEEGKTQSTVQSGSLVSLHYCYVVDGVKGDTQYITLKVGEESSEFAKATEQLIGRGVSKEMSVSLMTYREYCEIMADFITYELAEIRYFVTAEEIAAFRYQQASDRDPFYGESLYENLTSGKNRLYGLNSSTCESIVRALGGIAGDSTSTVNASSGLVGTETVAVGLSPAVLKKYGLYAYTVYFELPRGIVPIASDDDSGDGLSDYTWNETLGFTLYIGERRVDTDGSYYRYVASDLYDLVAKLPDEKIDFVDYDFATLYARRNLVLVDVDDVDDINVEFGMEDLKGIFNMHMNHRIIYIDANGKAYDTKPDPEQTATSSWDLITVRVTPGGGNMGTRIEEYIVSHDGYRYVSLTEFYAALHTGGVVQLDGNDPTGTTNYKELIRVLNYTQYSGQLTEDEKASVPADATPLFRMTMRVTASSGYSYTYDFYRVSDRRVMVRLYQSQDGVAMTAAVEDFYLSTFTFKKVVGNFLALLNGQLLNSETPFPVG